MSFDKNKSNIYSVFGKKVLGLDQGHLGFGSSGVAVFLFLKPSVFHLEKRCLLCKFLLG